MCNGFVICCGYAVIFVNLLYLRWFIIKKAELEKHIAEVERQKQHPINMTWEAASKMYDNAYAYRAEARKLRDEWKFAKMLNPPEVKP
jgi:hypothetical protein